MVLILGDENDLTTFRVIDYLTRDHIEFVKLNDTDILADSRIEISSEYCKATLFYGFTVIESDKIHAYYYRRGKITKRIATVMNSVGEIPPPDVNPFLCAEENSVHYILNVIFEKTPVKIGSYLKHRLEKLEQLLVAAACGLTIPKTHVSSSKRELLELIANYGKVATKGIKNNYHTFKDNREWAYWMYTCIFDHTNVSDVEETFAPTLFQEYINKKYEIRIFFSHGKCYSMAIFSQSNEKTRVDFRRYDWTNHNRTIPFSLPDAISLKIDKLMHHLGLDSGSIDMLVTNKNEYYFLEVNPDGQISMVSYPCNYFIEREIALTLSNKNEKRST